MKLTDSEKLTLIMLCEIYEKLGIKGELDSKFVKEAIFSGNTWGSSGSIRAFSRQAKNLNTLSTR
jgi:hypothetical protein